MGAAIFLVCLAVLAGSRQLFHAAGARYRA